MVVEIALPALSVVVITALIDSINPCAIGVLIVLIATLMGLSKDRNKMLKVGLIYISAVFVTYLAAGFGLLIFIQKFNISGPLSWFVGILIIILGLNIVVNYSYHILVEILSSEYLCQIFVSYFLSEIFVGRNSFGRTIFGRNISVEYFCSLSSRHVPDLHLLPAGPAQTTHTAFH